MSDDKVQAPEQTSDQGAPDELALLKQRAKLMGITYSNNIGVEALRAKVQAKMEGSKSEPEQAEEPAGPNPLADEATKPEKPLNLRQQLVKEQMRLVRLRITNLDPKKKDLPGEIFTIANRYLGTVRKFVPYGEVTDEGFHVPWCIYRELESRRFLNVRTFTDRRNGQIRVESNWAKEFALEVLPPLTREELARLATAQAAAGVFAA